MRLLWCEWLPFLSGWSFLKHCPCFQNLHDLKNYFTMNLPICIRIKILKTMENNVWSVLKIAREHFFMCEIWTNKQKVHYPLYLFGEIVQAAIVLKLETLLIAQGQIKNKIGKSFVIAVYWWCVSLLEETILIEKDINVKVNLNKDFSIAGVGLSKILSKYFWIVKNKNN